MDKLMEIKVSYNTTNTRKTKITTNLEVFSFIISQWDLDLIEFQEEAKLILLNNGNFVLGVYNLSKGGINSTVVDVRIILAIALKCNSTSIILVHNHPSGKLVPSNADIRMTEKLQAACEIMDIHLLDHLIITKTDFISCKN